MLRDEEVKEDPSYYGYRGGYGRRYGGGYGKGRGYGGGKGLYFYG